MVHLSESEKWIASFVGHSENYFANCTDHDHRGQLAAKTLRFFCVDCVAGPLCETGCRLEHQGHRILQVRKASKDNVVRAEDIVELWNIDDIKIYVINDSDIIFLPGRPQAKPSKSAVGYCNTCNRGFTNADTGKRKSKWSSGRPDKFCSISCKIGFIERPGSPRTPLPALPARKRKEYAAPGAVSPPTPSEELHGLDDHSPNSVLLGHTGQAHIPELSSSLSAGAESLSSHESVEESLRKRPRKSSPCRAAGVGILVCEGLGIWD